ncbi:MAG TPA: hypothetical protein VFN73_03890 [Propionibacteriaceae bacterium]|nr:hypothetical protein [Propionibacteriaceae bacterium]
MPRPTLTPREAEAHLVHLGGHARETYRWLRLGLLAALGAVVTSGLIEWSRAPGHCLQGSLSAYYWTPVRPMLVGGLMAFALGLIAVRGSTDAEDTALNLAGLFAPIVAVVPVRPSTGCSSVPEPVLPVAAGVDNNIRALLVIAGVVVAAVAVALVLHRVRTASVWTGWALAAATVAGFAGWALGAGGTMEPAAHYVAAAGVFGCLVVVVLLNARYTPGSRLTTVYLALAAAMVLALLLQGLHLLVPAFGWTLLATETALVALFAVFWLVQTLELWDAGVRPARAGVQGRSSP